MAGPGDAILLMKKKMVKNPKKLFDIADLGKIHLTALGVDMGPLVLQDGWHSLDRESSTESRILVT